MGATKLENSNIAGLNSDLAHKIRKTAAGSESAWIGAGKQVGVQVWHIANFSVKPYSDRVFYDHDAYIILNTYMIKDKIQYNCHFWLGSQCAQDEAGTAAYKAVELDDTLSPTPHLFREVQGSESDAFLHTFHPAFTTANGGSGSSFHHVGPTEYKPRLLRIQGVRSHVTASQVPLANSSINDSDTFVLDAGLKIYQWNGTHASAFEKRKGNEVCNQIKESRDMKPTCTIIEGKEKCDEFWKLVGGDYSSIAASADKAPVSQPSRPKKLLRLSPGTDGKLQLKVIAEGRITKSLLTSDDVFMVDNGGISLFVYIGSKAPMEEKKKCFDYANAYIHQESLPFTIPVSRLTQGTHSDAFDAVFDV